MLSSKTVAKVSTKTITSNTTPIWHTKKQRNACADEPFDRKKPPPPRASETDPLLFIVVSAWSLSLRTASIFVYGAIAAVADSADAIHAKKGSLPRGGSQFVSPIHTKRSVSEHVRPLMGLRWTSVGDRGRRYANPRRAAAQCGGDKHRPSSQRMHKNVSVLSIAVAFA